MKKLITILFLLVVVAGYAQPGFTPVNNKVKFYGISAADGRMSLPQDTFAVTGTDQNYPWVAEKSDKMWRWSTAQLKWVEMSEKNVSWAGDIYPVLSDTLLNYQHLLPVGSVTEYYRGDQTLGNFEGDVITVTNPLYVQYGDTTSVQTPLRFNYPLYKSDSSNVHVAWNEPTWNAARIQNIFMQVGTPTRNGMTWVYDSTANQWRHGFITPDGTVIPGIDSVWIANDSIYTVKGSDTTAQFIGFSATDISNWNTAYSWGNHATVGYLTNITGYLAEGANVTIDGTGTAGDPYVINAAGGGVTTTDVFADNLLVQPGYVTWSGTGLTFDVTAATYDIAHVRYNSAAGQITLDAADPTDPRIDVIAVDNTGAIVKITGTAEANPVQPQIDPSTQVLLTSILIPAGATTPYGVSDEVIYDENTEWTSAAVGLTANFDNATNNYNGSKSAAISGFSNGQYVQWTDAGLNAATNQVLSMQVRLSSNWNNSNNASVMLMRGAVPISQSLLVTNYGLVKTVTGGYQTVNIPITAFSPTDSFDRVRISFIGNSGNTVNVDYVRLQSGITTVGPVQDIHVIGTTFTGTTLSIATSDGKTYTTTINAGAATDTYVTGVDYSGDVLTVTMSNGTTYTTTIAASGGTSTHTVELVMPSAFNVSGPAVNTGTITVTGAGTSTQVVAGTGSLVNNKGVSSFNTSGSTYTLTLVDGSTYTGTLSGGGGTGSVTAVHNPTFVLEWPTASEDYTVFYTPVAITITEIDYWIIGTGSPSLTFELKHSTDRAAASPNDLLTSAITHNSIIKGTTTSFNDPTIPAGSLLWLKSTSKGGTVRELGIFFKYTVD